MPQVAVEKVDGAKSSTTSVFDEMKSLSERIRNRAFEMFEGRGSVDGFAMEDWLKAEQDFIQIPKSELLEQPNQFKATMNAPGFNADDIKVTALPDALIVSASSAHKHDKKDGDVCFCEFDEKTLYRRFELPVSIKVEAVSASLDKGVLTIAAPKAATESSKIRQMGPESSHELSMRDRSDRACS